MTDRIVLIENPEYSSDESQVFFGSIPSKILNLDWNFSLYLPKDLGDNYQILYFLHGAYGNHKNTLDNTSIKKLMDSWIIQGEIEKTVLVFIDGFNSFYVNSQQYQMEDAINLELLPIIEKRLNLDISREKRFIAGISMGGYGALSYYLKYPYLYGKVMALSPALWQNTKKTYPNYIWMLFRQKNKYQEVKWQENHPMSLIESYNNEYKSSIYIVTGDKDLLVPRCEVDSFVEKSKSYLDINYKIYEDGDHSWNFWDQAMPELLNILK